MHGKSVGAKQGSAARRVKCQARPAGRVSARLTGLAALLLASGLGAHAAPADLTALSLEQLMDISVVGASKYEQKQSAVAAAVSVITRQEISAFGWRTLDEALSSLPGLTSTYDHQYRFLSTRGFGLPGDFTTRVLVTINGNRFNDPVYDFGPFGRTLPIDLDLIERIEFIPGPGGAVYGQNAMFGVVNLVTRSGAEVAGTELALGLQGPQGQREGRASWGRRLADGTDLLLSVSGLRAQGQDRWFDFGATGMAGTARGQDGRRDQELLLRAARGGWSFDLVHGRHRKDDPAGTLLSDPLVPGQHQGDAYTVAQLHHQTALLDDRLQLSSRLFMGRYDFSSTLRYDGTWFDIPSIGAWRGAEFGLVCRALPGHKLMLGTELQQNQRQDQQVNEIGNPANRLTIARSGFRAGLYLQDEWSLSPTLTATLGLRLDRNNVTGRQTSPRAALIWQASAATTLKALYGRAQRAPNVYERDYDDGLSQTANPALKGERISTVELVADHRVGSDLNLRASVYQWRMQGLITLGIEPDSGLPQYQAGEAVHARGLELSADKTWRGGARLRGSASFQSVTYADGHPPLNSPKILARLNFSSPLALARPLPPLQLGYELRYDGARLTLAGNQLGGFAVSNLHLRAQGPAPGLTLSLSLQNLFNKRYAQPGAETNWQNALAQDGRGVGLTARYRF